MTHLMNVLCALSATLLVLSSSALAQDDPQADTHLRPIAQIYATGGVAGELATPVCHDGETFLPSEIAQRDVWTSRNAETSVLIDTGGLLARHGVARFASRHEPRALAQLIRSLGYHALAFGESDLGDPRDLVLSRARALRSAGVPYLATNLRCDEDAAAVCEVLVTGDDGVPIHTQGAQRIALLSYIDPEVGDRVGPDRMEGLRLEPLEGAIRNGVRAARAAGATLVVAIVDKGNGAVGAARVVALMAQLDDEDKPDLVFAARAGSELLFARPVDFRPALVAAPTRNAVNARVRHNGTNFDILAQPAGNASVAPAFAAFATAVGPAYCDELGDDLPGGQIDAEVGEMDAAALTQLLAGVMRNRANADIALLNISTIDERWSTERGSLTASDVNIAVQYDEPLMVTTVPAIWVRNLARAHSDDDDNLVKLGLVITNAYGALEKIKVNGRILDMGAMYDVVTLRFLAEGGDRTLPDADWEQVEDVTLRSALLDHLAEPRDQDPREALTDPWDRLEWTLRINTDVSFSGSAVRDDGAYQEGPLQNSNQTLLGLNTTVGLNALSRRAGWENLITATYSLAATADSDGFDEGVDQLVYRTTGNYRGFRANLDELYVPDLIAEGLLRSEFTSQDDRDAHFLNTRFTAGLQWRLHLKVKIKLLAGFEMLDAASKAERSFEPGFGAQVNIDPWLLMRTGLRKLTLTVAADYFVSGPGDLNRHLLQGLFDMQLNLNRFLALSFNVNFYGLKIGDESFSFATQTNVALRIAWTGRLLM